MICTYIAFFYIIGTQSILQFYSWSHFGRGCEQLESTECTCKTGQSFPLIKTLRRNPKLSVLHDREFQLDTLMSGKWPLMVNGFKVMTLLQDRCTVLHRPGVIYIFWPLSSPQVICHIKFPISCQTSLKSSAAPTHVQLIVHKSIKAYCHQLRLPGEAC